MSDVMLPNITFNFTDPNSPNYVDPASLPDGMTPEDIMAGYYGNSGGSANTGADTGGDAGGDAGTGTSGDIPSGSIAPPDVRDVNRSQIVNPQLPNGVDFTPTDQTVQDGEIINTGSFQLGQTPTVQANTVDQTAQAAAPERFEAATAEAFTGGQTPEMQAAEQENLRKEAQVEAAQQEGLSDDLKQQFETFDNELDAIGVSSEDTVQGQYAKLMDFSPGEIPGWAKGAYRLAADRMAARGISGSTIAGEAITTSLMQAALPIAQQDAQIFSTLKLAKLDKKAQGAFLRAGYIANLDMTNLNNRQQAAVMNAQSFLALDMKNLDNRQQAAVVNTQARMQKLLADNAAINAMRQFNASSRNDVNKFFSNLGAQVEQFNASQVNAMGQFNAGQVNSMRQFNANLQSQREQFNVASALQIEQSNTNYLRGINTANTDRLNQFNMTASQNLLNISNTAMANEIQLWRDNAGYMFTAGENALDRSHQMAVMNTQNQQWMQRYKKQQKNSFWSGFGNFLFDVGRDAFDSWDWGGGSDGGSQWTDDFFDEQIPDFDSDFDDGDYWDGE